MIEEKFVILKVEDIGKYLSVEQIKKLHGICETIEVGRMEEGKKSNFYAVINTDEPYFPEVKAIMRSYGHWEDEENEAIS